MKQKIYIETSIPSYLTARVSTIFLAVARQVMTRLWWNERSRFDIYVSEYVLKEIGRGDPRVAELRAAAIAGIPLLADTLEVKALAERLVRDRVIPESNKADAEHLAIASVHKMDALLTWNQKHLSGVFQQRKLDAAIVKAGYSAPILAKPYDFKLKEESHED
jgi:hypothetical protein